MHKQEVELLGSLYKEYNPLYKKASNRLQRLRALYQEFYERASRDYKRGLYHFHKFCFESFGESAPNGFKNGKVAGTSKDLSKVRISWWGKTTEDYDYEDVCYLPVELFTDDKAFLDFLSGRLEELKKSDEAAVNKAKIAKEDADRLLYLSLKQKFEPKTEGA